MIRFFRNRKISYQIAIASSITLVTFTIIISLAYYTYAYKNIKETYYKNSANEITQIGNFLDGELKNIIEKIYAIKYDETVIQQLKEYLIKSNPNYGITSSNLSRTLSQLELTESFVSSIYIYTPEGAFYDYANLRKTDFKFKESKIYQMLMESNKGLYWGVASDDEIFINSKKVIPLVVKLEIDGYQDTIYMIVNLDMKSISTYLSGKDISSDNEMFIINESGDEMVMAYSNATQAFLHDEVVLDTIIPSKNGVMNTTINEENYIVTYQDLKVVPWHIINLQSEKTLITSLNSLRNYILILSLSSVIIAMLIAVIFSRALLNPLNKLENTIEEVTKGNFDIQFHYQYDNEVGRLGQTFNFMIHEISKLIIGLENEKDNVKKEQELKRKAELNALQAQINPHFLYNTLSSIIWLANDIEASDIGQIASDLGEFYRIALSRGNEIIPIKDELKHVINYLSIQTIRYKDKLTYDTQIDEHILDYLTIKLILQPLVENAIYHGIKNKDMPGRVTIIIRQCKHMVEMIVMDNGPGMEVATLENLNDKLSKRYTSEEEGYGLFNVNERIKMTYGNEYGIHLQSTQGVGTVATIRIPLIK